MTGYLKNPNAKIKHKKRNLHEPLNVKVQITKIHSTSNQCYIEYQNLQGELIHVWVHSEEILPNYNGKFESQDSIEENIIPTFTQFNRIEYKKLLSNFEQLTAEKWCNTRKMAAGLIKDSCLSEKNDFKKLDERYSNNNRQGEHDMKFYREILYEVYDEQFINFCTETLNLWKEQISEPSLSKLEYLVNKGFREFLGVLQIWYRDRQYALS